jgi:hypothetical protein
MLKDNGDWLISTAIPIFKERPYFLTIKANQTVLVSDLIYISNQTTTDGVIRTSTIYLCWIAHRPSPELKLTVKGKERDTTEENEEGLFLCSDTPTTNSLLEWDPTLLDSPVLRAADDLESLPDLAEILEAPSTRARGKKADKGEGKA